jgi:ABC-type transporter Mla maintaining outer membrane lipid asymmetry ATPase subunit MlaF
VNTSPEPSLVEFKSVCFGYGERKILDDVSFQIPRGKVTALMGASGGGKTTVLRLIGGQYFAQSGSLKRFQVSRPISCMRLGAKWACFINLAPCSPI